MSDQNDKPVDGDEVVADVVSRDTTSAEGAVKAGSQEDVVEDKTVTITMSKRAAHIGALVLAGFLGFLLGVIGTRVAHHLHDGRGEDHGRGPAHMRFDDDLRMGPGQYGPGPDMMHGGQGYGPDDQRGPGMMQDGPGQGGTFPGQPGTPAPAETTK